MSTNGTSGAYLTEPWSPPAAPGLWVVITPHPLLGNRSYDGPALLDSGSGVCAIPRSAARSLGWTPVNKDYRVATAIGDDKVWAYLVCLHTPFGDFGKVTAIESRKDYAVIGRPILSKHLVLLDGPKLRFSILPANP